MLFTSVPASLICFIIGLAVFVWLCFTKMPRIISVLIAALIMSLGIQDSIITTIFTTLIEGTASVIKAYLAATLSGAVVGCAMAASGCANKIAVTITKAVGKDKGVLVIMLVSALVCASGALGHTFIILPIALAVCRESNISRGVGLLCYVSQVQIIQFDLVGIPAFPQLLPAQALGTTIYQHPLMSICGCIVAEILVYFIAMAFVRSDRKKGIDFAEVPEVNLFATPEPMPESEMPSFLFSLLPLIFMIGGSLFLNSVCGLASTPAAVVAQLFTTLFLVVTRRKQWHRTLEADSTMGEFGETMARVFPMIIITGFIGGLGSVIATMSWYNTGIEWAFSLNASPYLLCFLVVAIICFITSDAIAGMQMFLSTLGARFLAIPGMDPGALMRVISATSCTVESMPWTAGCYNYNTYFGMTVKTGWKYHFIGTVGITTFLAVFYVVWSTIAFPC